MSCVVCEKLIIRACACCGREPCRARSDGDSRRTRRSLEMETGPGGPHWHCPSVASRAPSRNHPPRGPHAIKIFIILTFRGFQIAHACAPSTTTTSGVVSCLVCLSCSTSCLRKCTATVQLQCAVNVVLLVSWA